MKITKIEAPFPAVSIDNFMPSSALVRSAAESFSSFASDDWTILLPTLILISTLNKKQRMFSLTCLIMEGG